MKRIAFAEIEMKTFVLGVLEAAAETEVQS